MSVLDAIPIHGTLVFDSHIKGAEIPYTVYTNGKNRFVLFDVFFDVFNMSSNLWNSRWKKDREADQLHLELLQTYSKDISEQTTTFQDLHYRQRAHYEGRIKTLHIALTIVAIAAVVIVSIVLLVVLL